MGSKKKSKANKLARMSEEEKIRHLQHRAAVEEEARRRKEYLISTFLKNKLKREQIFSRLNLAKINLEWRIILRHIKCIDLKQEFEYLFQWFDNSVNKKNLMLNILMTDLSENENQFSAMVWNQKEAKDKVYEIYSKRINYFFKQYDKEKNDFHKKANHDINNIVTSYKIDEEDLQATLHCMEEAFVENSSCLTSQQSSKKDELQNTILKDLENLISLKESEIERIWLTLELILRQYWERKEARRKQYIAARESDYNNYIEIFKTNKYINTIIDLIQTMKNKLTKVQEAINQNVSNVKQKKANSRRMLHLLKKRILNKEENEIKQISFMNSLADKTTGELRAVLSKGEKIIHLHNLCKKLEEYTERVYPDDDLIIESNEENEKCVYESGKLVEQFTEKICEEMMKLNKFWTKYNCVLLEKEASTLRYKSLLKEHKNLKALLKSYLSESKVTQSEKQLLHRNKAQFRPKQLFMKGNQN